MAVIAAFTAGRLTAPHVRPNQPDTVVRETSHHAAPVKPAAIPGKGEKEIRTIVIPPALQQLDRSSGSLANDDERLRLILSWAEKDPAAALDYARAHLRGDRLAQAMSGVLQVWGRNDPDGAWNWVATNMPNATYHIDNLLDTFGRKDPALAARFAATYAQQHPESKVETYLSALIGVTYSGDYAAAREIADSNSSLTPEEHGMLVNFVAGQWARYQPQEAAAWVMSLPEGELRNNALIGLGESWSDVDPAQAAEFAVTLPSGPVRQLALRQAVSKWASDDPARASTWILQYDAHEDFDQAVASIATTPDLANTNINLSIAWGAAILNDQLRLDTLSAIFSNWHDRNPTAAMNYLQNATNIPVATRDELLKRLAPAPGKG
jgi:hypothetical protein